MRAVQNPLLLDLNKEIRALARVAKPLVGKRRNEKPKGSVDRPAPVHHENMTDHHVG
jgi:hypothetical protein